MVSIQKINQDLRTQVERKSPSVKTMKIKLKGCGTMDYLLAIDQGTTGTTAIVMDTSLNLVSEASIDFEQSFPKPGWVEHDLDKIWKSVVHSVNQAIQKIDSSSIVSIGITNQRETICFWDRKTTQPLSPAIVWQDRRTADFCLKLQKNGKERAFRKATGLLLDPYFSGTKVAWAFKNWPAIRSAHKQGRLAVGTIDSFLLAKISHGKVHATEPSNASRTLCFHLTKHRFDEILCKELGIPKDIWPEVQPTIGEFAKTMNFPGIPDGIPVTGVIGDQQSALLGQACVRTGNGKCTFGTGAFLLLNTGKKPVFSKHRLVTTVAWALNSDDYTYALEGSAFIAGAAIQWVRDGLGWIGSAHEIEKLANTVSSSEGVVFVPALTGLGAPYWDPEARGMFYGMTRGTTKAHMARAVLEGVAFQNADIFEAMRKDLGRPLTRINVDGGASANSLLMQIQSNFIGQNLTRPRFLETTSLGAIFASGLGSGVWKNLSDIEKTWKKDQVFHPQLPASLRKKLMLQWHQAVRRSAGVK